MDLQDIKLKSVKYKVTKFELILPGYDEPFKIDNNHLGNFTIEKDFENDFFPYLEFKIQVPDKEYEVIMTEGQDMYVDLKLEYSEFNDITEMDPNQFMNSAGTIMENRFYAFVDNSSPMLSSGNKGTVIQKQYDGDSVTPYSYNNQNEVVLLLYRKDHILPTNQIINTVLSKLTTTDTLVYYFKQLGIGEVLMSPAQNNKVYNQMILAPIRALGGMRRIIRTYGIHDAGTTLFFDYDKVYVLDKQVGCTAWINNEYKTTYLGCFPGHSDNAQTRSGFYTNGKEKYSYINVLGNQISIERGGMFTDQMRGANVLLVDSNTGETAQIQTGLRVNEDSQSLKGSVNRIEMIESGENQLSAMKEQMLQGENSLTVIVDDVNIRALSPNKDFILTTDHPEYIEYNGHFRATSQGHVFTKESSLYTCRSICSFVGKRN